MWAWLALAALDAVNLHVLHAEQRTKLVADDEAFAFVDRLNGWVRKNPGIDTLVYDRPPGAYHDWGVMAAWRIAHGALNLPALYAGSPQAKKALAEETVAYALWDTRTQRLVLSVRRPGQNVNDVPN